MDSSRQPDPGRNHPPPPRLMATSNSPQTRPIAPYQQPSLPSIRQLHPYLPPSGMAQHLPPADPSAYTYPLQSPYSGPSGSSEIQQPSSQHTLYGRSEMLDSDPEGEIEQQGPAKKKRRRQALSCNECKRRKIKCDRAQPCGPCTRRGEQSKCQWRTLEPVDKYVSRTEYEDYKTRSKAEYDELKARLDHLESVVARFFPQPTGPANVPMYSIPTDISGASSSDNVTSYHSTHSSAGQTLYVPPSSSFTQDPAKSQSYAGSSSPHIAGSGIGHGPSISSSNTQSVSQSAGPSHLRHPSDAKSPTIVRQSPLSLASITSPYNADSQPKNFHAQTFRILGERLRLVKSWKGPVDPLCGILKRWNMLRCPVQQVFQWKARQCRQGHTIYRHRDVMVILP